MNKKILYIILGIGLFILLVSGIYCATTWQQRKIQQLQKQVAFLKQELIPIRFKILYRKNDTILVSLKFYDLDHNVITYYDKSGQPQTFVRIKMLGNELSFDFIVVPVGNRFLAFPFKIFTDQIPPKDGVVLFPFYDKNDFPQIYYSQYSTPAFNSGIKALFNKIVEGKIQDIKGIFGSMVQDVSNIQQFQTGKVYRVVFHPAKGGIEIIQEQ